MSLRIGAPHRVIVSALFVLCTAAGAAAQTETIALTWDPSPEPSVAGYYVYAGPRPDAYTHAYDAGGATSFGFPDAVPGEQYWFTVVAYGSDDSVGPPAAPATGFSNARPWLVNPGARSSKAGEGVSLTLEAGDVYGDPLTFYATGVPFGMWLSPSGVLTGAAVRPFTYTIKVTVTDGRLSATETFSWTVQAATPTAPLAGTTPTAVPR